MIQLSCSGTSQLSFIGAQDGLVGPLSGSTTGSIYGSSELISHFKQWRGSFDENGVIHDHDDGNVSLRPEMYVISFSPTAQYPCRMSIRGNDNVVRYANMGIMRSNGSYSYNLADPDYTRHVITQSAPGGFRTVMFRNWVVKNEVSMISIEYYSLPPLPTSAWSSILIQTRRESWEWGNYYDGYDTGRDWKLPQSYDAIVDLLADPRMRLIGTSNPLSWRYVLNTGAQPINSSAELEARFYSDIGRKLLGCHGKYSHDFDDDYIYGELAHKGIEKLNFVSINSLAFLADLRNIKSLAPKLRNLATLKTHADNYLTLQYGILPTISDIKSLIKSIQRHAGYDKNGFREVKCSQSDTMVLDDGITVTTTRHLKIAVSQDDDTFCSITEGLDKLGLLPDLGAVWDLIPYSFAIDWLVNVGNYLDRIDSRARVARLPIRYVTMSRKTVISQTLAATPACPYSGTVNLVHYHRWSSDQCPVPTLSLQTTTTGFNHWLESAALIVQRMKR